MKKVLWFAVVVLIFCSIALAQEAAPAQPQPTAQQPAPSQTQAPAKDASSAEKPPAAADKATEESLVIPKGAKIFVASMPNGFDEFMKTAIQSKKVPVTVVSTREEAEFELTGHSESQKASAAKIIIMGSWHSRESASIRVTNLKSGVVAFAYSYNTDNSARGKKTSSEACAKHLKEKIESGK